MGRDKALLPFAGATLIEHVAAQVLQAVENVTVVGRPEEFSGLGLPVIDEDFAGCGPMSGIEAALRQSSSDWALITACDMPGIQGGWLRRLADATEATDSDAVITVNSRGEPEPLLAVYHARLRTVFRNLLEQGRFSVREALGQFRVLAMPLEDPILIANVNTPQEWATWSR